MRLGYWQACGDMCVLSIYTCNKNTQAHVINIYNSAVTKNIVINKTNKIKSTKWAGLILCIFLFAFKLKFTEIPLHTPPSPQSL